MVIFTGGAEKPSKVVEEMWGKKHELKLLASQGGYISRISDGHSICIMVETEWNLETPNWAGKWGVQ